MDFIVFGTTRTRRSDGPALRIRCPACGADAPATSFETEERIRLYFVPLPTQRERHVVCRACGEDRLSGLPLAELVALGPEEAGRHLYRRVSLVAKVLAVASLLLFCLPFVSVPLGGAAMVVAHVPGSWPFWVGLAGAALTTLLWGGLLLREALAG